MCVSRGTVLGRRPPVGVPSHLPHDEDGFTLLELMVVLTIAAILIFIAAPGFATARRTAQDHAAQAELRTALEAVNTAYADNADLTSIDAGSLTAAEPSLHFVAGTVNIRRDISVSSGTLDSGLDFLGLAEPAGDGTCWYALETDTDPPVYGVGPAGSGGSCSADDATGASSPTFPAV